MVLDTQRLTHFLHLGQSTQETYRVLWRYIYLLEDHMPYFLEIPYSKPHVVSFFGAVQSTCAYPEVCMAETVNEIWTGYEGNVHCAAHMNTICETCENHMHNIWTHSRIHVQPLRQFRVIFFIEVGSGNEIENEHIMQWAPGLGRTPVRGWGRLQRA